MNAKEIKKELDNLPLRVGDKVALLCEEYVFKTTDVIAKIVEYPNKDCKNDYYGEILGTVVYVSKCRVMISIETYDAGNQDWMDKDDGFHKIRYFIRTDALIKQLEEGKLRKLDNAGKKSNPKI